MQAGLVSEVVKGREGLADAAQRVCDAITLAAPRVEIARSPTATRASRRSPWLIQRAVAAAQAAPKAVAASKALVFGVAGKEITDELIDYTAEQLASIRVAEEAVCGMKALLAREKPYWAKKPLTVSL